MDNNKKASSISACQLIIALLVFAQIPIMFGKVESHAIVYMLPWVMAAFPLILICIVFMYKNGEFLAATMNAFLSGVMMGQNFVRGIIELQFITSGTKMSESLLQASQTIDMWAFLAGGIILLVGSIVEFVGCKMAGIGLFAGSIGFFCMSAMYAGLGGSFGTAAGVLILILAVYLLYGGLAQLVNNSLNKEILPVR